MKIEGVHRFAVAQERLYEAILDPEILARTMPGCESLERVDENRFRGALNIAIGPVKGQFQGTLELTDLDPPNGYHMALKGQGPTGFMKGAGKIELRTVDDGTELAYDLDAQVGGRIAAVGQRLLDSSAKVVTQQGLEGLAAQVEVGAAPGEAAVPGEAAAVVRPAPPSQSQMAARFAGGLWKEMVPAPVRRALEIALWLALGAVLGWWLRGVM